MKMTVCLSLALVLALVLGSDAKDDTANNRRVVRGFRLGAADRFSHGFGKRGESNLYDFITESSPNFALPVEDFADLLHSSERLAYVFVQNSVDKDGDGYISKDEILGYRK